MTTAAELPTLPDDLSTATPPDIDAHFAALDGREWEIDKRLRSAIDGAHRAIGERGTYHGRSRIPSWPTTSEEALERARSLAAAPAPEKPWLARDARTAVDRYDAAMLDLFEVRRERTPLSAEWRRRGGWSRFFEVLPESGSKDGHIHESTSCKTCNRNGKATRFGWHPELSGLTEADAVKARGPILCSVCFPSAPLEWTTGPEKPAACENAPVAEGTRSRPYGPAGTRYGDCTQCKATRVQINSSGRLRRHKPVA